MNTILNFLIYTFIVIYTEYTWYVQRQKVIIWLLGKRLNLSSNLPLATLGFALQLRWYFTVGENLEQVSACLVHLKET